MKIYVASSWRNEYQPLVVLKLIMAGHEVYDFRQPDWNGRGFHWSEIDSNYKAWDFYDYVNELDNDLAVSGFNSDMDALKWCDLCLLVLPCGRSAHLELGWAVGQGKRTAILHTSNKIEPELMSKMVDSQFISLDDVIKWIEKCA